MSTLPIGYAKVKIVAKSKTMCYIPIDLGLCRTTMLRSVWLKLINSRVQCPIRFSICEINDETILSDHPGPLYDIGFNDCETVYSRLPEETLTMTEQRFWKDLGQFVWQCHFFHVMTYILSISVPNYFRVINHLFVFQWLFFLHKTWFAIYSNS